MADPGFPVGGGGGTEPLGALTSDVGAYQQKTYAKTKRLDPVGGRALAAPPGSANDQVGEYFICDLL